MCAFMYYTRGLDDRLIGSILSPVCWIHLASLLKKEEGRGEQMADSLPLRQRATVHTSCWSWCLAASLCSGLKEQRLARLISLNSATSNCTGVLVSPIQSESCVTQVGSPVVCSSYNIFLLKMVL